MKKFTLLTASILLLSLLQQPNAQMAPARSDAYQGVYPIKSGIGLTSTGGGTELPAFIRASIYFRFYTGLHLVKENPTGSGANDHLMHLKIAGATSYPYFNSYKNVYGLDSTFNWFNWGYKWPTGNQYYNNNLTPAQAHAASTNGYQEYNKYYNNNSSEIALSIDASAPTQLYARLNQKREKLLLSLYTLFALNEMRQRPMTDLRVTGMDNATTLRYRNWFSLSSNGDGNTGTEYTKINLGNTSASAFNVLNNGEGDNILNFNKNFDAFLTGAGASISANTEGAVELTGLRNIAFNNDIDACGESVKGIDLKYRMLTVGGTFFWAHASSPYQLSDQHFMKINITRPAIAFPGVTCGALGPEIIMVGATTGNLTPITLNITEAAGALLPGTETTTSTAVTIDPARVRVSLVLKSDYDAAVADGSIATNNDLPVVAGFAYLTQENLAAIENTIQTGQYMIKYDYSAPDSKTDIKTEGDKLGEVFAKSIYRPLTVTSGLPVTFDAFEAKIKNGQLLVNWTTLKETNNSHFEIEVSNDGRNFKNAGKVNSLGSDGNSAIPVSYKFTSSMHAVSASMAVIALLGLSFAGFSNRRKLIASLMIMSIFVTLYACTKNTDTVPNGNDGKVFVRIAQVDNDGTITYSKTIEAIKE